MNRLRLQALTVVVFLLPATGIPQEQAEDAALQSQWIDIQSHTDRDARKAWWQDVDPEPLRVYIEAGVGVDIPDRRGWTPLHSAARYSADPQVLSALLQAGAVVDARNKSGDTPLHWAAADNPNIEIIAALLEAGADVNAKDRFGWQPIHTAADRSSNPEVIATLLAAGAQPKKRAYFVLFRPKFLLKHNSNMPEHDKELAMALLEQAR